MPSKKNKKKKISRKKELVAQLLTRAFSVITSMLYGMIVIYLVYIPNSTENAIKWFGSIIWFIGMSILTIVVFMKLGKVSDWDISKREERPKVYAILLVYLTVVNILAHLFQFREAQPVMMLVNVSFAAMFLITLFWKISAHTYAVTLFACIIAYSYPSPLTCLLFGLPFLTAWTRVVLKKHTISQTVGGILLAGMLFSLWLIAVHETNFGNGG